MQWKVALDLLREMLHDRAAPDAISFSAAISACDTDMQWKHALELLREMFLDRVTPDTFPSSAAFSAYENANAMESCIGSLARDVA